MNLSRKKTLEGVAPREKEYLRYLNIPKNIENSTFKF